MNKKYVEDALSTVIGKIDGLSVEKYFSERRVVSRGDITVKEIIMNYKVRSENLKRKGNALVGYDELEDVLGQSSQNQMVEFVHYTCINVLVSLFFINKEFIGYFYSFKPNGKDDKELDGRLRGKP